MDSVVTPVALVALVGPQASGKSTLASALGSELRRRGEQVAVVELDLLAAMALPTLPSWEVAHQIFETVTGLWARSGLTCVIAEGSGHPEEVAALRRQAPDEAVVLTVATTTPFDVALARAQADPTRGLSKEHAFLSEVYDAWPERLQAIAPDVVVDTDALDLRESVDRVRQAIEQARTA
jgi:adenylylsulfate kinase-like enzyme